MSHYSNFHIVKTRGASIRVVLCASLIALGASCSWLPFSKGCCEDDRNLGITYLQEPEQFPTAPPVYGRARDTEPGAGETITKPGLLSKYNPFKGLLGDDEDEQVASSDDDEGFLGNLFPF